MSKKINKRKLKKYFTGGEILGALNSSMVKNAIGFSSGLVALETGELIDSIRNPYQIHPKHLPKKNTGMSFALGTDGTETANVEVEGDEFIKTPDGQTGMVNGPDHEEGGVPMDLPVGTEVYSKRLRHPQTGETMAERAEKREARIKEAIQKYAQSQGNYYQRNALNRLQQTNKIEEEEDMAIQQYFQAMQEQQQMDMDNPMEDDEYSDYEDETQMFDKGGKVKRESDKYEQDLAKSVSEFEKKYPDVIYVVDENGGNYRPKKTDEDGLIAFEEQLEKIKKEKAQFRQSSERLAEIEKKYPNVTFTVNENGVAYRPKSNDTNGRAAFQKELVEAKKEVEKAQLKVKPNYINNYERAVNRSREKSPYELENERLAELNYQEAIKSQGKTTPPQKTTTPNISDSKTNEELHKEAEEANPDNYVEDIVPPLRKGKDITTNAEGYKVMDFGDGKNSEYAGETYGDRLGTEEHPDEIARRITNTQGGNTQEEGTQEGNEVERDPYKMTIGDSIGAGATTFKALAPLATTIANKLTDKPLRNYWENFGTEAIHGLERNMGTARQEHDKNLKDIQSSSLASNRSARNNVRGINSLRASQFANDAKKQEMIAQATNAFSQRRANLEQILAQTRMQADRMRLLGRDRYDMAVELRNDNFWTNLGMNMANIGNAADNFGSSIRQGEKNETLAGLVEDLYGEGNFGVDANGRIVNRFGNGTTNEIGDPIEEDEDYQSMYSEDLPVELKVTDSRGVNKEFYSNPSEKQLKKRKRRLGLDDAFDDAVEADIEDYEAGIDGDIEDEERRANRSHIFKIKRRR